MSAQGMPPHILALFAPRPPLEFVPPLCGDKKKPVYTGISEFVSLFETTKPPPVPPFETPKERIERKKKEKLAAHRKAQDELIAAYDPHAMENATKNPYATLFVGRLSYEVTEKKLKKEFECYGPIRKVKVITNFNGESRGYAFIEFETEEALKIAYKQGDGKKIDGRRVIVDVERSRTVPRWIPRRLGGGKGPARYVESKKKAKAAAAAVASSSASTYSSSYGSGAYSSRRESGPMMDSRRPGGGLSGPPSSQRRNPSDYQRRYDDRNPNRQYSSSSSSYRRPDDGRRR